MALFSDGPIVNVLDLQSYESAILSVANIEAIDLGAKITLAQDEIATQLNLFLLQRLPSQTLALPVRRRSTLDEIVVTPPLKQWHAHKALAMTFRDAYNNQLNDRYRAKVTEYEQLAKLSREIYLRTGVALAADPIVKASPPEVATVAGPGAAASYYVAVTWVNRAGQEGAPSDVGQASTEAGELLVVRTVSPPPNVVGWNVYLGAAPEHSAARPMNRSRSTSAGPQDQKSDREVVPGRARNRLGL